MKKVASALILSLMLFVARAFADNDPCQFIDTEKKGPPYSWPVKRFQVAQVLNSPVTTHLEPPHFHDGLDLKTEDHETVCLPFPAIITYLSGVQMGGSEMTLVDKNGLEWGFAHLDAETIPQRLKDALKTGETLPAGQLLGRIRFPLDPSFHHLHLSVSTSSHEKSLNPFSFFDPILDSIHPELKKIFLYSQDHQQPMANTIPRNVKYSIMLTMTDEISNSPYKVPPYRISFSINDEMAHLVWRFDELPPRQKEIFPFYDLARRFFGPSLDCEPLRCHEFMIDLGFQIKDQKPILFDFPTVPGSYKIYVNVQDFFGNESSTTFSWTITD